MQRKKRAAVLAAVATIAVTMFASSSVSAADQGNWTAGCAAGWTCMWEGGIGSSAAAASTQRDSNFSGDSYHNGHALNNRVLNMQNRFSSTSVRGYSGATYSGTTYACLPPGYSEGAWPFGVAAGMTSFRSC